jgi:putative transposase
VAWDEPGHAHFVTFSCFQRLPLLTRDRTRRWVITSLEETRRRLDVALWAYVIMPEHVHVLLYPLQADYEMRLILVALERPVSDAAKRHLERTGNTQWLNRLRVQYPSREVFRFWQPGGGFDHNIFPEKTVPTVTDYIHANPVRRGLVKEPTDWERSSARFWDGWSNIPIRMDEPFV